MNEWEQARLLGIINIIKDINRATDEKCDITYAQIQGLDYADRLLADVLGFEQPKDENGNFKLWADYALQKKIDKKSKK